MLKLVLSAGLTLSLLCGFMTFRSNIKSLFGGSTDNSAISGLKGAFRLSGFGSGSSSSDSSGYLPPQSSNYLPPSSDQQNNHGNDVNGSNETVTFRIFLLTTVPTQSPMSTSTQSSLSSTSEINVAPPEVGHGPEFGVPPEQTKVTSTTPSTNAVTASSISPPTTVSENDIASPTPGVPSGTTPVFTPPETSSNPASLALEPEKAGNEDLKSHPDQTLVRPLGTLVPPMFLPSVNTVPNEVLPKSNMSDIRPPHGLYLPPRE